MCIRKFIQQTVFIRNITQIDIFSINLTDTISVCIYNPRIIQQFLRTFRIIGVWVVQFLISIGQVGWKYGKSRCIQSSDRLGITDSIIIDRHQDRLAQCLVTQNAIKVHPGKTTAHTCSDIYSIVSRILEFLDICYVGDVLYQVNLSTFQCHCFRRVITHIQQVYFIIRNFFPEVRVCDQCITDTHTVERIDHVRTGSDSTVIKVLRMLYVYDTHGRMTELSHQVSVRLCGLDCQCTRLIIRINGCLELQIFFRFCGTGRSYFFQMFVCFFYFACGKITSVRELQTFFQSNDPFSMIIIHGIAFCQPWFQFHVIVELEQCLCDSVTHRVPATVLVTCSVDASVGVHCTSEVQNLLIG